MVDGATVREHLQALERQSGFTPDQLKGAEFPEFFRSVWSYFLELCSARTSNGFGANPITFLDIKTWAELTQTPISPNEVRIIKQLDSIYLTHQAKKSKD